LYKQRVVAQWIYSALFRSEGFSRKLVGAALVWAMVMSSLPTYAVTLPRDKWVSTWKIDGISAPSMSTPHEPSTGDAQTPVGALERKRPRSPARVLPRQLASLPPYSINPFKTGAPLFTLPVQAAGSSPIQVSVGFVDNSSLSANFPEPWNETNPAVNFVGGGSIYRAGAIRLDNPAGTDIVVDNVTVDLGRPGPMFQLWTNVTIPANGSAILTQTQDGNFNTSASPIVGCGLPLAANETRVPKVTVTIGSIAVDYLDSAHVLDTGGFDSSCRGNQSLEWRPIGTA